MLQRATSGSSSSRLGLSQKDGLPFLAAVPSIWRFKAIDANTGAILLSRVALSFWRCAATLEASGELEAVEGVGEARGGCLGL
jgi:hypothetical protein